MQVAAQDQAISWAVGSGQLELNAFLPLIAFNLLGALDLLTAANRLTADRCLRGITVRRERCREAALRSSALATVLVPVSGYHRATEVADVMRREGISLPEAAERVASLAPETVLKLLAPEIVNALGFTVTLDK